MSSEIHLGYELGTGQAIAIPLRHTGVTGQTQQSGKTTTLEALITRSGLRAVAYVTKRGESSFHVMHPIAPYFRERADWQFVASLLEATLGERLKFQRSWIQKLCRDRNIGKEQWKAPKSLADVLANVERALENQCRKCGGDGKDDKGKRCAKCDGLGVVQVARGMNESVYFELREYLQQIIPQIERLPYSTKLALRPGVNVMDLAAYDFPLQALVIRSAIEWIHNREHHTITVIPEAWKFAPKLRGSPVRLAAEELIRQGAALDNFIWLDTQDLAGVADVLLRQVGVWILGVQRAKHEVDRTLAHIPEDIFPRPRRADIMRLERGQFIVCWEGEMYKVYVQPAWMSAAHAEAIARGEEKVETARDILREFDGDQTAIAGEEVKVERDLIELESEDPMWEERFKALEEKYNALLAEFNELKAAHDALAEEKAAIRKVARPTRAAGGDVQQGDPVYPVVAPLDQLFQYVRKKAREDPELLAMLAKPPEIQVTIVREKWQLDMSTILGKVASLVAEGFFAKPQATAAVAKECVRRGFCAPKTPYSRITIPLEELAARGFLTRETEGYQAVSKMKVTMRESAA